MALGFIYICCVILIAKQPLQPAEVSNGRTNGSGRKEICSQKSAKLPDSATTLVALLLRGSMTGLLAVPETAELGNGRLLKKTYSWVFCCVRSDLIEYHWWLGWIVPAAII